MNPNRLPEQLLIHTLVTSHRLGSTTLLSGECLLTKNGAFAGKSISMLSYDQDLGFFKIVTAGNIWMQFKSNQIVGSQVFTNGALIKRYHVAISVKFPTGDEYNLNFLAPSQGASVTAKAWIDNLAQIGRANIEVQSLLKVKEKVTLSEIGAVLAKRGMSSSASDARHIVEGLIASGTVDGVLEGETFVSRFAKQRETVNYQVVTSFDVAKNGAISLKCPSCGSPVHMRDASPSRKCDYCGAEFMVPRRILDML